jgi:hypothetical protein
MQIRLFIDEDAMSRAVAHNLRMRGIDVTTVGEESREGLDDTVQLDFAASQDRVLYTFNVRDFYRLHTEYLTQGRGTRESFLRRNNVTASGSKCAACCA